MNDEKVIDNTINNFEKAYPNRNKFIILFNKKSFNPRYVKSKNDNLYFSKYNSNEFWDIIGDISIYTHIILHFLCHNKVDFVNKVNHDSITWSIWGSDLYSLMLEPKGYKLHQDEKLFYSKEKVLSVVKKDLTKLVRKLRLNARVRAIKKIKYVVGNKYSIEILTKYFPSLHKFKYKNLSYYALEDLFGTEYKKFYNSGDSIVIGNSAHSSGNHIYAFNLLSKFNLGNRKIIVPLSYPKNQDLSEIHKNGQLLLGLNYNPLLDYVPLVEYNKLLSTANTFIFANIRGQAFGNIIVALYFGAKVYLDSRNPMLPYLRDMGLYLFSIDELSQFHLDTALGDQFTEINRKLIVQNFSRDNIIAKIKSEFPQ